MFMLIPAALVLLSSVCSENRVLPLEGLGDTVQLSAIIAQVKCECGMGADGDIHVVLQDSGQYLLAEIMPGSAPYAYGRSLHAGQRVTIVGLRYFDHEHGPRSKRFPLREHNHYHVEIHPVTRVLPAT